ncbi:MAG: DNA polymerase III subunit [Planctomycetota bacterium]
MAFDEVLGHEQARDGFCRALKRGRIAHAYLLGGPEGVGKRLLALQVAATLLCPHSGIGSSASTEVGKCGDCGSCHAVNSANHGGLQILTPGEGRGIDLGQIREMLRFLSLRSGERRVVLLEPAERLAEPAANALLKILEEPPPGAVFLLVSHRPAQLLATIVSRCQSVMMGPLAREPFLEVLAGHQVEQQLACRLYQGTGGRPGAALSLVEAIERCGGEQQFRAVIASPPEDPRDLVAISTEDGAKPDRDAVLATVGLLADGVWAYRGEDPADRRLAAERATLLAQVARHVEWSGSPDLALETAAMILSALDPAELRFRLPRSLGVA